MEIREGLLYAKSHEWVKEEGDVVTIGLTDYAQSELGDLVCKGCFRCIFTGFRSCV